MYKQTVDNRAYSDKHGEIKTDFDKVGRFKFSMNSALGWLSAFFCLAFLLILSFIIVLPPAILQMAGFLFTMSGVDWFDVNSPICFAIVGLTSFMFFFGGMVIGRYLLRAIPPRLSGKRRKGVIGIISLSTIFWVVGLFQTFKGIDTPPSTPGIKDLSFFVTAMMFFNSAAYKTLAFLSLVFWWLGFSVPLGIRHLNLRYFLKMPFILFLRRFSKFPDRTVQHALLKCTPAGKPVAFLTPTRSRAGDWNPFRVGFSGIKFWRPIRSMPVILRSTNEAWRRAAKDLINHAETIVLDVSEGSGSVKSEIDMVNSANRWHKAVILINEGMANATDAEQIAQFTAKGAQVVVYKKSWILAFPRLIFGLLVSLLVIIYFFLLQYLLLIVNPTISQRPFLGIPLWFYIVVDCVLFCWMYIIFFVRPALKKDALRTLSKRLRSD